METLPALVAEWVVVVFIGALGVVVLYKVYNGSIPIAGLLNETGDAGAATGKGSMSRLQLLMFTFVIIGLYLTLSLEAGALVDIPNQALGLLGISGGSYLVSKGIQNSK